MLRGFALHEDGSTERLTSLEEVRGVAERTGTRLWVDASAPTTEEMDGLGAIFKLDPIAREDCIRGDQLPRTDEFEDYIFLVLYGALGTESSSEFMPRKLSIFFNDRFLVTVHREAHRSIEAQLRRCEKHPQSTLRQGLDHLLHNIVQTMVSNYGLVAEEYTRRLDALEEKSLRDRRGEDNLLEELIALRRELLDLRRVAAAQRDILQPIADGEMDYVSEDLDIHFSRVRDHLALTLDVIDNHREILHGIRENYNLTLSNRLNETMKILTVYATVFMPLTLISSIYGMNVPLWPNPESPWTFWGLIVIMAITGAGLLAYFRRKKWY